MKYISFALATFLLIIPMAVSSAGLVPCGGPGEPMCNSEFVALMANGVIRWLISVLGVIAVIVLVYAGFKMVVSAGDTKAFSDAKQNFTNIVIGIVIILAAWLVVDTLMSLLTGQGLGFWSNLGR